ncbi:MAG: hypothetical protein SAK29_22940 [Scytonema sp. PMC 1069.18]|nr:hypothetical protein [Scytonema sp. PMC 1069.18]MEC4883830.1 hypothetical protein [Scytonema sp. PMC 1070.18]
MQYTEQTDNFEKISLKNLQKKYEVDRPVLSAMIKYLRIKTWKIQRKTYLDAAQIAHMDGLHNHIKSTGGMEGYPIPDSSKPLEDKELATIASLAIAETQQVSKAVPNYAVKDERSQSSQQVDDISTIVKSAQSKAAGVLITENLIARQYLENPEMLPDELKQKIRESGEVPTIDPFAYAESLIAQAQIIMG